VEEKEEERKKKESRFFFARSSQKGKNLKILEKEILFSLLFSPLFSQALFREAPF